MFVLIDFHMLNDNWFCQLNREMPKIKHFDFLIDDNEYISAPLGLVENRLI